MSGQVQQAETAYRSAIHASPRSQTAHLALAHLLEAGGRDEAARALLGEFLARGPDYVTPDPWWQYSFGRLSLLGRRVAELRGMARQ